MIDNDDEEFINKRYELNSLLVSSEGELGGSEVWEACVGC
jgi:hypothetical protein